MGVIAKYLIWWVVMAAVLNLADGFLTLAMELEVHRSWKKRAAYSLWAGLIDLIIVFGYFLGW